MHYYAQTNIQLLNQLQREGYSKEELILINNVYELAMKMFPGQYRPSGKTFIAHLVGTASILASLHTPIKIVAAGLIHAIYPHGDFGGAKNGISNAKRERVRAVVGEEVEEYVCRYPAMQFNAQNIVTLNDRFDDLDPIDRDVLLIRIVNELEDNLDMGILYCFHVKGRKQFIEARGSIMIEIAQKLDFSTLAVQIEDILKANILAEIPIEIRKKNSSVKAFAIAPKSYHRKLPVALYQEFMRGLDYSVSFIKRVKRKLRSLYLTKLVSGSK